MEHVTGFSISKDSLYRLETGKQTPSVNFMIAMNIMLNLSPTDCSMVEMCIPKEWNDLSRLNNSHDFDTEKWNIGLESIPL
ncbi:hypothetical protein [Eggerthella sp. YY7918]|uniref:hypothetical protein n=1 Tax=Eggerthella sp. (strain YY7918) TaxID=502558 RepID=UPI0012458438|nr:hypothetical protein [Eggerthella sp. YY7918]